MGEAQRGSALPHSGGLKNQNSKASDLKTKHKPGFDLCIFPGKIYVSLSDSHKSLKEIHISIDKIHKWKREIHIFPEEIYISSKETRNAILHLT